jgi:quinoprotein glucose dehydrogenase
VQHGGQKIPVVIQGNKSGLLFVLNRYTGAPVFPVEERPAPQTDVPGEVTSPTQPFPTAPPALAPQHISADDAWGLTPEDREACRKEIAGLRNDGIFTPPSVNGSLHIPGNVGGMNWSGSAFDPERGLLVVNTNNFPTKMRLIAREQFRELQMHHTEDGEYTAQTGAPYGMFRRPLLSPKLHMPCVPPPWGMLTAVDMTEGKIRWQVPLGSFNPSIAAIPAGTLSLGGAIVTAGGLIFIGGTYDPSFRAFDVETGKELWKAKLPASGHALPMTYQMNGKQYLVIAAGGHAKVDEEPQSDSLVAFAL